MTVFRMPRELSTREQQILAKSLRKWIDIERTDGNDIAAALVAEYLLEVERWLRIAGALEAA